MKKIIPLLMLIFIVKSSVFAQFPGCPDINAGPDQVLPCSQNCTNLTATPFHTGQTTTYTVGGIPHTPPIAYNAPGGNAVSVGTDDVWSPITTLPFNFCYYGNNYNTVNIGSNGSIQFGPAVGGGYNPWAFTASCPNTALTAAGDVFGVYQDTDPSIGGTIKWYLLGTAPCRIYCVVFNQVPMYTGACNNQLASSMIVIYETTNVIDVYVQNKTICATWNGGRGIIGIQNPAGTLGVAAPGRNANINWNVTTPEGWRFTPNGAPNYSVAWFDGATQIGTGNTINVCPGGPKTYTSRITYTSCNGTTVQESDNVNVSYGTLPAPPVIVTAETCAGANNGAVNINNPPGAGPYNVNISGASAGSTIEPNTSGGVANFTNLPDGNYNYTVSGLNGCSTNGNFTIAPGGTCCAVTAINTPVLCTGANTGTATANPTGVAPFTYSWTGGQTNQTANNLNAGSYTITLTDNTGCVATANTTITQPALALTATSTGVNISCNGACNGSITVNASGGTGAYQYSLNGGAFQASNTFSSLCSGAYAITVRDANNCTFVVNRTLTQPNTLSISVSSTLPATCGANTGQITVSASGGTTAYQFNTGGPNQSSPIFSSLAAGSYTINVIDANGCTNNVAATVLASSVPSASISLITNISCNGGSNGSVLIAASGGTGTLTYSLNNNVTTQASNSFSALTAGSYTATVTDGNGCQVQVPFTITQPSPLTFTNVVTNVTCNGLCDGQVAITPSGGTAPYTYSSNAGSTFQAVSTLGSLCTGAYVIVVKDDRGCLNNINLNITQPGPISATFVKTNPICHNQCNGTIVVTPSGGTPTYNFSINGGASQASNTITNGCGGANSIVITDANGCTFSSTQNLINPPEFLISEVVVESNCGFNNGSINATLNSPNGPINYFFDTDPTPYPTGVLTNLFGGAYLVTAVDALGCSTSEFIGVSDIEMSGIIVDQINSTCFGSDDGGVAVTNLSGANPISYLLDANLITATSGTFTTLDIGSHIVTIFDGGNCIFTLPFSITEPDSIIFEHTIQNVACNGANTGQITISNPLGGNGVYSYSINGGIAQASPIFNGLSVGNYTVRVIDGNNCESSLIIPVSQNTAIVPSVNVTNLTCNNDNSGFVLVGATGGGGTYEYSIDGIIYSPSSAFVSLDAGAYTITIQDQFLCTETINFNVTQPAPLTATFSPMPALCNNICNGQVTVTANGGTTPYQFSADNGVSFFSTNTINGLCDGNVQMVVKDSNNCIFNGNTTITEPTPLAFTPVITNETCGLNNGVIDINASGATPNYSYSINAGPFVVGNSFTSLNFGSYNLAVKDLNNCELTSTVVVLDLASPSIIGTSPTQILCNNVCTGEINVSASGGTGSLDYNIGGADQASNLFSALCANTYTVTITDDNGCTDTENVIISEPAALSFTTVISNALCFGDNNGQIDFNVLGGVSSYQYSSDNGVSFGANDIIQFLPAGNYNLQVKDANNCIVGNSVTITEPNALTLTNPLTTNVLCNGSCTGIAEITPIGGTGTYDFSWTNTTAATGIATGLCAGGYDVEVEDDNGCQASQSFNITEPAALVISSTNTQNISCNGVCDGTIEITSLLAVQFSVDNGATFQASNTFTDLCAGVYTIVAQDANGCEISQSITLTEPALLIQNSIPEDGDFICYNGFGTLSGSAIGGTVPYTFVWNATDSTQYLNVNLTTAQSFTSVVVDANGCISNSVSALVNVRPEFIPNVTDLVEICPGQNAVMSASAIGGLTPYNYQWLTMSLDTMATTSSYNYVPTGNDSIMLVAWDACYQYDTLYVPVNLFLLTAPNISADPASGCSPLTTELSIIGSQSNIASVTWNFGDGSTQIGTGTATHTYVPVGTYDVSVQITTLDGCSTDTTINNLVTVSPDPIADFLTNPLTPSVVESTVNFTNLSTNATVFNWDFGAYGTSNLENPSTSYGGIEPGQVQVCLNVESIDGCLDDTCKLITFVDEFILFIPNSFTPDGDEHNNVFKPVVTDAVPVVEFSMLIFNRWGEVIFETKNINIGWDGTYRGEYVKEGAYVWKIIAKLDNNSKSKEYVGHINVMK